MCDCEEDMILMVDCGGDFEREVIGVECPLAGHTIIQINKQAVVPVKTTKNND